MARDDTARERSPETTAPDNRENDSKLLGRREYMRLAGASVAALGLGASSATADEGGPENSDDWELAFEDQFDAGSLDTDKWSVGFGWGRTTNSPERIVDRNVWVENERLHLKVTHDGGSGSVYAGAVNTKNKVTYGPGTYWEARLRTPDRHGLLPAFWAKSNTEQWPPEIDFFEMLGNDPTSSHHNVHYDSTGGMGGNHSELKMHNPDLGSTTDFHVYGCAWYDDRVEMYVDGQLVGTHDDPTAMESLRTGAPFYMMLNIHVGRTGTPDYSESWGDQMDVDWVRVWEQSSNDGSSTDTSSTDTEETTDLPNTLSVSGDGSESVSYSFSVTDTIEKSTARDGSISPEDTIDSGDVEGIVAGGTDSYDYAGRISSFSVDGSATIYRNGDRVSASSLGSTSTQTTDDATAGDADSSLPNLVVVDGSNAPNRVTSYTFEVDGDVAKDPEHGSINAFDDISDGTVSGRVVGGKDAYRFAGEITRFETDGAAFVSVQDSADSN
ncbi:glycoside hydrolase family 16 protein [Halorussus marinus]|uniref:glycoside hydrolase family 16 protein n=1 Tax=Halorussus marinus TaxID=2505976 RepID=UPI001092D083|nr:glycoside hydrolase family 16 protein [Halorussus marinus]